MKIRNISLSTIIEKLNKKEHFSFVRLLHGFWDRVPSDNIENYADLKRFLERKCRSGCDNLCCYADLLEMVRNPKEHVWWGVWPSGCHLFIPKKSSISTMKLALDRSHVVYDGTLWKRAILDNEIDQFIDAISQYKVVVIGFEHLKTLTERLNVKKCDFIEVKRMLTHDGSVPPMLKHEFKDYWEEYHLNQNEETIVYLTQLSIAGAWIIGQIELENAFVFDMGLALDYWAEWDDVPIIYGWMKRVKHKPTIKEKYDNWEEHKYT